MSQLATFNRFMVISRDQDREQLNKDIAEAGEQKRIEINQYLGEMRKKFTEIRAAPLKKSWEID